MFHVLNKVNEEHMSHEHFYNNILASGGTIPNTKIYKYITNIPLTYPTFQLYNNEKNMEEKFN